MGFRLEKGQCSDYIYSVDYRSLKEEETAEYFDFFFSAGWTHIASEGEIHLFRASPGTKPIYSDRETVIDKHDNLGSSMKWGTISMVIMTALLWIGAYISFGTLQMILTAAAAIASVIAIPMAWTVLTIYNNKWKAEEKRGLVNLTKMIPPLFFLGAVICLAVLSGTSNIIRLISNIVIGAIALPALIWVIMSISNKWGRKRS